MILCAYSSIGVTKYLLYAGSWWMGHIHQSHAILMENWRSRIVVCLFKFKWIKINIKKISSSIILAICQVFNSQWLVPIILDGTDREKSHQCSCIGQCCFTQGHISDTLGDMKVLCTDYFCFPVLVKHCAGCAAWRQEDFGFYFTLAHSQRNNIQWNLSPEQIFLLYINLKNNVLVLIIM